jgi:hypothetical protein
MHRFCDKPLRCLRFVVMPQNFKHPILPRFEPVEPICQIDLDSFLRSFD